MKTLKYILVIALLLIATGVTAQSESNQIFTWRQAAMTLEYPAQWQVGLFEGNPILATDPNALTKATEGMAPGAPAITFLYYPQTRSLTPAELMNVVFPEVEPQDSAFGLSGLQATFSHEATGQTVQVIAFQSPATRNSQIIMAAAPQAEWSDFEDTLTTILASARFLGNTAEMDFLDSRVSFEYPNEWSEASDGQVLVVSPDQTSTESIIQGDFDNAQVFVRSQILRPAGVGINPEAPTAASDILLRFIGIPVEEVEVFQQFNWAEGMPAASAWFDYDGMRLLMVAVVKDENAMLIGGGCVASEWGTHQASILGALNLTRFDDIAPLPDLTAIVTGQITEELQRFGAVVE